MKRILIADDDKRITTALSVRLVLAGYEPITAHSGFAALQMTLEQKPDLLLVDVWMPGMGLALVQELRELGHHIPTIVMTASCQEGLPSAAQKVGAAAFVHKPYEPRQLLETIRRTLTSARTPRDGTIAPFSSAA